MRVVVLFCALAFALIPCTRAFPPPPSHGPGPQIAPWVCFTLPQQWCNQFNLSLEKYDSVGNAYYYGVDSSCFSDTPEDVMYGVFYVSTATYVFRCEPPLPSALRRVFSIYWNMTNSAQSTGLSTIVFSEDRNGNWQNGLSWASVIDPMKTALQGPDWYLTPQSVQVQRCQSSVPRKHD